VSPDAQKVFKVDRSAWFMRFADWAWGQDLPGDLSFCLLFWGLLLSPFIAVAKVLGLGTAAALRGAGIADGLARLADRAAEKTQSHPQGTQRGLEVLLVLFCLLGVWLIVFGLYRAAWWALLIPGNVVCLGWAVWALRHTRLARVLYEGYRAAKTRTCPRVEFVEPPGRKGASS
jgi:hypothetical protein